MASTWVINEDMSFNVLINGVEKTCEVLGTFKDPEDNRLFVVYTDYEYDDNNEYNMFASEIVKDADVYRLEEIYEPRIIDIMNAVIEKTRNSLKENGNV